MIRTKKYLLCVWLAVVSCLGTGDVLRAKEDVQGMDFSIIPPRPSGQILDAARWFSRDEKEHAQKELDRLFRENQIDVYIVILSRHPPQGAHGYSRALGEAWSRAPVWCVVFLVPGDPSGFSVQAGGDRIDQQGIDRAIAEASNRARREATQKDRVMAAWKECSEILRFLHGAGKLYNEQVVDKKKEIRSGMMSRAKLKGILILSLIGFLALVPMLIYLAYLIRRKMGENAVYKFPATGWRTRYQAPYSGGSGILVSYQGREPETGGTTDESAVNPG